MAKTDTVHLGPWGGEGGDPWSYTVTGYTSNIFITYDGNGVNSIRFACNEKGMMYHSKLFGNANGTEKEIRIDTKVEKLLSIEGTVGTYNSVKRVTSLGFTTSKSKNEPVGAGKKDSEFSCLLSDDHFNGFHGRCGTVLNSIGISSEFTTMEVAGPSPSSEGEDPWDYISKGPICQISITYDDYVIHSLQFASRDANRFLHKSNIVGREDGSNKQLIKIDTKVEIVIGIEGAYGPYEGTTTIKSLSFITNNYKLIGPFGTQNDEDTSFSYSVPDKSPLYGFHGEAGSFISFIRSIGIYMPPIKSSIMVGPFIADKKSKSWSYQPKGLITRIILTYSGGVHTLQFESIDVNGNKDVSDVIGYEVGMHKYTIDIEKEDKITNISGKVDKWGNLYICGLYISTKKYVYGPFGVGGQGTRFSFPVKNGYICGFHGMSTNALQAIGVYVKPT